MGGCLFQLKPTKDVQESHFYFLIVLLPQPGTQSSSLTIVASQLKLMTSFTFLCMLQLLSTEKHRTTALTLLRSTLNLIHASQQSLQTLSTTIEHHLVRRLLRPLSLICVHSLQALRKKQISTSKAA